MRFAIKSLRGSGEMWLVRASARAVWGGPDRARMFMTKANAEACLGRIRAPDTATMQVVSYGKRAPVPGDIPPISGPQPVLATPEET
jgi:hypothetical protein